MSNLYQLAQSLKDKFEPNRVVLEPYLNRKDFLSQSIIPSDILVYSGSGASLKTNKGVLIDFASMTVNCILGQNDPWVNANIIAYLNSERPSFLTTRLGSECYFGVAKRILGLTSFSDGVINHRQCNGTDVNELAIFAAYYYRKKGRDTLVSFKNSYHGQSLTAYLMSGLQRKHQFLINESPVVFLDYPSHAEDIDKDIPLTQKDMEILDVLKTLKDKAFAVIMEPIQVNNGVNTPSKFFMLELKNLCQKFGIALIFDEVQTGFGWLGTVTAGQRYGLKPNLMAMSKAITAGNGPLAVLISDKKYQNIPDGTAAKTNGADIRSLVAANAVMDRLVGIPESEIPTTVSEKLYKELREGLLISIPKKGEKLLERLQALKEEMPNLIGRIKGDRLIRGIEILGKKGIDSNLIKEIQFKLMESGVLVRHCASTLIFKTPAVITEKELDRGFEIIKKTLFKYK
ncbi:aminotransferase class III-fold pyridoxal phosphate-dependent enzyme [Candidatus Microgenomates bacterium]|nr:MAG: aminotransferase class III-fold pyridoxal phosphate-dependent enzyme [Candidatus Microgenomates bacterium]